MPVRNYEAITRAYPRHIPLPMVPRPHRSAQSALAAVRCEADLYSRLLFGDLEPGSFTGGEGNWSAVYSDAFGNGLGLSVRDGHFAATSRFLGKESLSEGKADSDSIFMQLIGVATAQWDAVLKEYLESMYTIHVSPYNAEWTNLLYLPDGWPKAILVPIAPANLGPMCDWYEALVGDRRLGAAVTGSVDLVFNAVNYVEGRCPKSWYDADELLMRGVRLSNSPVRASVIREEARDGSAAWTARRDVYLLHCDVFLRDVPHFVASLAAAGLLSEEPDLCAAVVPAGMLFSARELYWWSPKKECRHVWEFDAAYAQRDAEHDETDCRESRRLIQQAVDAGKAHHEFFGLKLN